MTDLTVVGLSHHTAPLALRERLSVSTSQVERELKTLMAANGPFGDAQVGESLLLSTCNRVEIYAEGPDAGATIRSAREYFRTRVPEVAGLYEHRGAEAARHAFRVASSLDSMVIGEPQILGQMKDAVDAARRAGTLGTFLDRCFTRAFAVAKKVRTETRIASGAVSIPSIACELARKIFGDVRGRRALLVGAGEMGEQAAERFAQLGARLTVMNRSGERAATLAQKVGGEHRGFEHLPTELTNADVVLTSTSSDRFVLTSALMKGVVRSRRRRPLFVIDIAVPRNVDPRVGGFDNVFLYDVDDLDQVAADNLAVRREEAVAAEAIVETEVMAFESWKRSLSLAPTIVALRNRFSDVVRAELERTMERLGGLNDRDRVALERMSDAMVNKLLHQPLSELKRGAGGDGDRQLIEAARRLFALDEAREHNDASLEEPRSAQLAAQGKRK